MERGGVDMWKILLIKLLDLLVILLIIHAILSWFHVDRTNPIVRFIDRVAEYILNPIRRFIPPIGGIDISPIIAIAVIYFLQGIIRSL